MALDLPIEVIALGPVLFILFLDACKHICLYRERKRDQELAQQEPPFY